MNFAIIAAGEGSRLAAEGVEAPKPLVRIGDTTLVERLVAIFAGCGAESVRIIVSDRDSAVVDALRDIAARSAVPLDIVVKTTPDSMHSFAAVTDGFEGRFIVTTVDTVFSPESFAGYVAAFAADTHADGYMGVTPFVDDEKPLFVETADSGTITAFSDTPGERVRYVSAGVYGLGPEALKVLRRCLDSGVSRMRNYQRALVQAGLRLRAVSLGKVVDIDHASDIAVAEAMLGINPSTQSHNHG